MLQVYFGNDTIAIRQAAFSAAEKAAVEATLSTIDAESYQLGMLADTLGAVSLFGGKEVFILDNPSTDENFNKEVINSLDACSASEHTFIVIEGPLLVGEKKPYQAHAVVVEEFKRAAEDRFNVFSMTDALIRKDKKTLWLLLQQAVRAGLSAEEIIGTLWWQLKTIRLASLTSSETEAGLKPFPYKKAKQALNKFPQEEVEKISRSLLALYHDGHAGLTDIDLALERWVLTL